jgi:hypothetical protein
VLLPTETAWVMAGFAAIFLAATALYNEREGRRKSLLWTGLGLGSACAIAALAALIMTTKVIWVSGAPEVSAETKLLFSRATLRLGDRDVVITRAAGTTIVVNDSVLPLRIETVIYAAVPGGTNPPDDVAIEPHTAYVLDAGDIDYVGRDDPPPHEVSSRSSTEHQHWLTW